MRYVKGVIWVLVLALCGCKTDPDPIAFRLTSTPAPVAPVVKKSEPKPMPPTVYDLQADVGHIPKELEEKLSEAITLSTPTDERVWFLKVEGYAAQKGTPGKPWYNIIVYFRPRTSTARLRRGKCTTLLARPHDYAATNQAEYRVWKGAFMLWELPYLSETDRRQETGGDDYAQASPSATQPFGPQLDVPTSTTCPFAASAEFTDDELVAIVDFVGAIPDARRRVTPPLPILSVKNSSRGHIEVLTGSLARMKGDQRPGEMFTLQPKDATYALIAVW